MKLLKNPLAAILIVVGLLNSACQKNQEKVKTIEPVRVETVALANAQNQGSHLEYTGTIQANKVVQLSFLVSGNVTSVPVAEGQFVKKGQLIATVDETAYRSQYEVQMAQVRLAEENYKRIAEVFRKGSIAEIRMLEAKSQYDQARSAARATYQNIAHTKLYAPQSGYIGAKKIEAGSLAAPGAPAVQILDISRVSVAVPIPEAEINTYQKGDKAQVTVPALGNKQIEGTVDEVAVLAAAGTPNYTVKISLPNPSEELKPGMVCNVAFQNNSDGNATATAGQLIVPVEAVQVDVNGQNYVYVASADGKMALRKTIQTGTLYNNGIRVTKGLQGSENLITSGYHKLTDSTAIQIVR
ncbi:efflux RND transporter periplasmic adaptor subunit [Adhaeribacter aquaticus]|uniref:efflux RND transporter periplasmic adaptor subunit n=1 Tax=Adhaeribacter aquaticus TaxID=299567 RepID=UPI00041425BD|nr:efflux RND transporter periplasmic adaptor subunit [Adhaeribacter aquaticus]